MESGNGGREHGKRRYELLAGDGDIDYDIDMNTEQKIEQAARQVDWIGVTEKQLAANLYKREWRAAAGLDIDNRLPRRPRKRKARPPKSLSIFDM